MAAGKNHAFCRRQPGQGLQKIVSTIFPIDPSRNRDASAPSEKRVSLLRRAQREVFELSGDYVLEKNATPSRAPYARRGACPAMTQFTQNASGVLLHFGVN
jgi:hypothetical protein